LCQPRSVRAEDNLTYKLSSYTEDDERIKVTSHCGFTELVLGQDRSLKSMRVADSIGGATPTGALPQAPGDPTPAGYMKNLRKAADLDFTQQVKAVNFDLGYAMSTESDYISRQASTGGQGVGGAGCGCN
jgi:hypothetical protein